VFHTRFVYILKNNPPLATIQSGIKKLEL
jgi:hypothetical protein